MTSNMGIWGVSIGAVIAFATAFHFSRLVARTKSAISVAKEAVSVINEKKLEDEEKERLIQSFAIRLFSEFFLISLTAILVLAAPALVIVLSDWLGIATQDAVSLLLLSWEFILGTTLIAFLAIFAIRRR